MMTARSFILFYLLSFCPLNHIQLKHGGLIPLSWHVKKILTDTELQESQSHIGITLMKVKIPMPNSATLSFFLLLHIKHQKGFIVIQICIWILKKTFACVMPLLLNDKTKIRLVLTATRVKFRFTLILVQSTMPNSATLALFSFCVSNFKSLSLLFRLAIRLEERSFPVPWLFYWKIRQKLDVLSQLWFCSTLTLIDA